MQHSFSRKYSRNITKWVQTSKVRGNIKWWFNHWQLICCRLVATDSQQFAIKTLLIYSDRSLSASARVKWALIGGMVASQGVPFISLSTNRVFILPAFWNTPVIKTMPYSSISEQVCRSVQIRNINVFYIFFIKNTFTLAFSAIQLNGPWIQTVLKTEATSHHSAKTKATTSLSL